MKNSDVSALLSTVADLLDIRGDNFFKIRAYRMASQIIHDLSEDIETVVNEKRLEHIDGIGPAITKKVTEYITTGSLEYLEKLQKEIPPTLLELLTIPSLGPRKVSTLFNTLQIQTIEELKTACQQGKLRDLDGFGILTEHNILRGIALKEKTDGRIFLHHAMEISDHLINYMKRCDQVEFLDVAGSLRRKKETIGDIDILISSPDPASVMEWAIEYPQIQDVIAKGPTKTSILLKNTVQVDIRVVPKKSYGAALQYFTGSKEHNVGMRSRALKQGFKLNEYGLFTKNDDLACSCQREEEIYTTLNLSYIPPELRENRGEIKESDQGTLPILITQEDIKGDIHVHSHYSDGQETIASIVQVAEQLGYEYIGIADHSQSLRVAHGLSHERVIKKAEEIKELNKTSKLAIFLGTECDILPNGELDYDEDTLNLFDYVGIGIHTKFKMTEKEATERIIQGMTHPKVTFLAHPTCRLLGQRESLPIKMDALFDAAIATNTALEINSFPDRLDLSDIHVKQARDKGAHFCIGTDAHTLDHLHYMKYGIATARRGWLSKNHVLNTQSLKKIQSFFKKT